MSRYMLVFIAKPSQCAWCLKVPDLLCILSACQTPEARLIWWSRPWQTSFDFMSHPKNVGTRHSFQPSGPHVLMIIFSNYCSHYSVSCLIRVFSQTPLTKNAGCSTSDYEHALILELSVIVLLKNALLLWISSIYAGIYHCARLVLQIFFLHSIHLALSY